jgi:hypothetical protein
MARLSGSWDASTFNANAGKARGKAPGSRPAPSMSRLMSTPHPVGGSPLAPAGPSGAGGSGLPPMVSADDAVVHEHAIDAGKGERARPPNPNPERWAASHGGALCAGAARNMLLVPATSKVMPECRQARCRQGGLGRSRAVPTLP